MDNEIDYSKKVIELTIGELHDLIANAVYEAINANNNANISYINDLKRPKI